MYSSVFHVLFYFIEGILILSLLFFVLKYGVEIMRYIVDYLKYYIFNNKDK